MTTRRKLIAGAAAAAFAGVCGRARAQAPTQIRISTAAPPSDFLAKALEQLKADVDAASVGLDVSVHPASTLFKQGTEVPALQRGNLEMSTMTTFEVAQQIAELGYFNRGYLLRDYDQLFRVFDGADRRGFSQNGRGENGHRYSRDPLSRHAPGQPAAEARRQSAGRSRRRQDAHAGGAGMAPARPHARRHAGAARHAGSLSRHEDRHGGRPGKSAVHSQRGEILRSLRADRADRAHGAAGVLRHRQAGLGQAQRRPAQGARRRPRARPPRPAAT